MYNFVSNRSLQFAAMLLYRNEIVQIMIVELLIYVIYIVKSKATLIITSTCIVFATLRISVSYICICSTHLLEF